MKTVEEYAAHIKAGDDPAAVLRVALREADAAALERAAQLMPPGQGYGPDLARRIRALAQPAPGGKPDARCGYTMTVRLQDFVPLECELPPSHTGPHRNDIAEWTSPPSALAQPAPAPPSTSAADDPQWDGTDAAHPAWWRGERAGSLGVVTTVNEWLDGRRLTGTYCLPQLQCLRERIRALASPAAEKRAEPEGAGQALRAAYEIGYRDCEVCHDRNPDRVAAPAPKADPREEGGSDHAFVPWRLEDAGDGCFALTGDILAGAKRCDLPESAHTPAPAPARDLLRKAAEAMEPLHCTHSVRLDAKCYPECNGNPARALLAKLAARAGRG